MICPLIGSGDCLCHQHPVSHASGRGHNPAAISVSNGGTPRSSSAALEGIRCCSGSGGVLRRFVGGEAIVIEAGETMGTQHSSQRGMVCPNAGVKVTKANSLIPFDTVTRRVRRSS
ncbi:unnamed protein product [Schistocephalus solidus]|uniref:Uncharacterized protein n=1 Tax=Schistocephalus solidus TaxID=70667 RepID=A0A183SZG1_SCHSO|nr:unnamed protein product [Schistocephalus solidus]